MTEYHPTEAFYFPTARPKKVELRQPVKEAYEEAAFHFSGTGTDEKGAKIGDNSKWPHPQARSWGEGNSWARRSATSGANRGLRQPHSAVPAPRPRLPWNKDNHTDPQFNAVRQQEREERRRRERAAIESGAFKKEFYPKPWLRADGSAGADLTPPPIPPMIGEGFSHSLQTVKRVTGDSVRDVLGPRTVITTPGLTAFLTEARSSNLFNAKKDENAMLSIQIRGSLKTLGPRCSLPPWPNPNPNPEPQ